ncbi:MAG: ComF family protein [bacterium]
MNIWLKSLLDLVYPAEPPPDELPVLQPPLCQRCGEPFEGQIAAAFICRSCQTHTWAIRQARAPYVSAGYVRETIHAFKYERQFHHLPQLSQWLEEGYRRFYADESFDGITPVPLHWSRKWARGFNQAKELAHRLSRQTGSPLLDCLKRIKKTKTQTRLRRSERFQNQRNAYALKIGANVRGAKLLLIDDIFTTGATTDACARALRKSGAAEVAVLTVARG